MDDLLSSMQNRIYQELLRIDKKAGEAYKGALKALTDIENPDRFSQSAHSLREVTNIISRNVSIPQKISDKEVLKERLERKLVEQGGSLPSPSEKNKGANKKMGAVARLLYEYLTSWKRHF